MNIKSDKIAKPIVKNKFWVVEDHGTKVATIQAVEDGVVYVHDAQREKFPSIKLLSKQYNIVFDKMPRSAIKKQVPYGVSNEPELYIVHEDQDFAKQVAQAIMLESLKQ